MAMPRSFPPPTSEDGKAKKKDFVALLRNRWPRWESQAAIEALYGSSFCYSTMIKTINECAKAENRSDPKPPLPTWVGNQSDYTKRADELAAQHDEKWRIYSRSSKKKKPAAAKRVNKVVQIYKSPTEKIEPTQVAQKKEPAQQIAKALNGRTAKETEHLLAIAELYLEVRDLKKER